MTNIGMSIGISHESVKQVTETILQILDKKCDQDTMQKALDVLADCVKVNNVSVSNCNIYAPIDDIKRENGVKRPAPVTPPAPAAPVTPATSETASGGVEVI